MCVLAAASVVRALPALPALRALLVAHLHLASMYAGLVAHCPPAAQDAQLDTVWQQVMHRPQEAGHLGFMKPGFRLHSPVWAQ